jgi:hypothetical protein
LRTYERSLAQSSTSSGLEPFLEALEGSLAGRSLRSLRLFWLGRSSSSFLSGFVVFCEGTCVWILNLIATIAVISISAVLGYWAQDRSLPITVLSEVAEPERVRTEDILRVRYQLRRHRMCSVILEQDVFDGKRTRHRLPTEEFLTAPGPVGLDEFAIPIEITKAMAGGKAHYRSVRSYYCNPLQRILTWPIIVIPPDAEFEIVETVGSVKAPPPEELRPQSSNSVPPP